MQACTCLRLRSETSLADKTSMDIRSAEFARVKSRAIRAGTLLLSYYLTYEPRLRTRFSRVPIEALKHCFFLNEAYLLIPSWETDRFWASQEIPRI